MPAVFEPAFQRTIAFEGKTLETVAGDSGGMTYFGISRRNNPTWAGWAIIDSLTQQQAEESPNLFQMVRDFYKQNFWDKNLMGKLFSQQLACQLFDAVVNMGGSRPIRAIQNIVGATEDGIMGLKTVMACNFKDETELVMAFIFWRKTCYQHIVENHPADEQFLNGWLSRCQLASLI